MTNLSSSNNFPQHTPPAMLSPGSMSARKSARGLRKCLPSGQAGFTVIELMTAVTISLLIVVALTSVLVDSTSTSRTREGASELQINGRLVLEQIKTDLIHSGFLGVSSLFFPDQPVTIVVTGACDSETGQLSHRVRGGDDSNIYSATCIPTANYARGDILLVRALDPTPVAAPYASNRIYYKSAYEGGKAFVGPTPPDFTGTSKYPPYFTYALKESAYFISPFTTAASETPLVPAMYRAVLSAGPGVSRELVASGVEDLQIRYGVFQTNDTVRYFDADELNASDWDLVRSVQIWVLMRTARPETGYTNTNTYVMGTASVTKNDGYRRLLLSTVVQLRN